MSNLTPEQFNENPDLDYLELTQFMCEEIKTDIRQMSLKQRLALAIELSQALSLLQLTVDHLADSVRTTSGVNH